MFFYLYIQVWVYSEGHRQSFIEESIVHNLGWLLSIIPILNVLVQTVNIINFGLGWCTCSWCSFYSARPRFPYHNFVVL